MVDQFTAAGYGTDLQYAEDDIPTQLAQVENMITKGVKVVPSYLLEPISLGVGDIEKVLVESGYYTADQLK